MLSHYIQIDANDPRTLQDQIKSSIANAIFDGFVPKEQSLISSRRLAESLKVSRNTILRVYEQLTDDGVLISAERKGYFVNPALEISAAPPSHSPAYQPPPLNWNNYLVSENSLSAQFAQDLKRYPYLFVNGMVDDDLFPVSEWRRCSMQSLNRTNHRAWTSNDYDYDELIEQIRIRVLTKRGIFVDRSNIAVTLGC